MEIHLNHTAVRILQADITTLDVDAVVNAANTALWMGDGMAGAIKRRALPAAVGASEQPRSPG